MNTPTVSDGAATRFETFFHALAFVLGFSTVFVILGMAATRLGQLLSRWLDLLTLAGGVMVIVFGLFTLGAVNISFLNYDTRQRFIGRRDLGLISSYLMGVFFSAGWTPCTGPVLGTILMLGLQENTVWQGGFLLIGYSLGLGIPFLLTGLAVERAMLALRKLRRAMPAIKLITGSLLVWLGVLMLVEALHIATPGWAPTLRNLQSWAAQSVFQQSLLEMELGLETDAASPTFFVAVLAGLLSFLSPCVLPLAPAYISYLGGRAVGQIKNTG